MLRKLTLVAVAGATLLAVTSAGAQIAGNVPDGGPPPPGYGRQAPPPGYQPQPQPRRYQPPVQSQQYDYRGRGDGWDGRPRYGYDEQPRYRQRGRFGDYCATSRGACQTRPQPVGTSCRCDIDGLTKRGIIQ